MKEKIKRVAETTKKAYQKGKETKKKLEDAAQTPEAKQAMGFFDGLHEGTQDILGLKEEPLRPDKKPKKKPKKRLKDDYENYKEDVDRMIDVI